MLSESELRKSIAKAYSDIIMYKGKQFEKRQIKSCLRNSRKASGVFLFQLYDKAMMLLSNVTGGCRY